MQVKALFLYHFPEFSRGGGENNSIYKKIRRALTQGRESVCKSGYSWLKNLNDHDEIVGRSLLVCEENLDCGTQGKQDCVFINLKEVLSEH